VLQLASWTLCDHFLGWDHSGIMWASFWYHVGIIVASCECHFGILLASFRYRVCKIPAKLYQNMFPLPMSDLLLRLFSHSAVVPTWLILGLVFASFSSNVTVSWFQLTYNISSASVRHRDAVHLTPVRSHSGSIL
jgi:hypothetical protein